MVNRHPGSHQLAPLRVSWYMAYVKCIGRCGSDPGSSHDLNETAWYDWTLLAPSPVPPFKKVLIEPVYVCVHGKVQRGPCAALSSRSCALGPDGPKTFVRVLMWTCSSTLVFLLSLVWPAERPVVAPKKYRKQLNEMSKLRFLRCTTICGMQWNIWTRPSDSAVAFGLSSYVHRQASCV